MCNNRLQENDITEKFRTVKVIKCGKTYTVFLNDFKKNKTKKQFLPIDIFKCLQIKSRKKFKNNYPKKNNTDLKTLRDFNLLKSVVENCNWFLFRVDGSDDIFKYTLR